MDEIMSGEATPAQIAGVPRRAARQGRDGRRDRRLRGGDARARRAGAPRARRPRRHGRHGRRRRPHVQHLDGRRARRRGGRGGGGQARQPRRSSASGSADVLEALGFSLEQPPERIARSIDELGFGFMFAPLHHPAMRHAAPVRQELGDRTVFNVLGPLTNPAGARAQVFGVYAPALVARSPTCSRSSVRAARSSSTAPRARRALARRARTSSARWTTARCASGRLDPGELGHRAL